MGRIPLTQDTRQLMHFTNNYMKKDPTGEKFRKIEDVEKYLGNDCIIL